MYSSTTPNLKLPQWGDNDHPDFLAEMNDAYMTIDQNITCLKANTSAADERLSNIEKAIETINNTLKEIIGGNVNG